MLILAAVMAAIVVGWLLIGPRILPARAPEPAPVPSGESLAGRWTATPDEPMATTLALDGATYAATGELAFTGAGRMAPGDGFLSLTADPQCPDAVGRYEVELGEIDRDGLLPEHRAQTMALALIEDACADGTRADVLTAQTWVLRASDRDDVRGICDPPNEEAAITGHWPEPSGCG